MRFTKEQVETLFYEDVLVDAHGNELAHEIVEEGEWIDSGKYQYKEIVFKVGEKFYRFGITRAGSYWSDYDYWFDDAVEVRPVKKVIEITTWEAV